MTIKIYIIRTVDHFDNNSREDFSTSSSSPLLQKMKFQFNLSFPWLSVGQTYSIALLYISHNP